MTRSTRDLLSDANPLTLNSKMQSLKPKFKLSILLILFLWIGLLALYGLLKPIPNGCVMTYMYPTYIPISTSHHISSSKYALYLYHEGWKKIDFNQHLNQISGVPLLFIPGNGGSYKQVRSLAAESDRAYQGGSLEQSFYQEASPSFVEGGCDDEICGFCLQSQYSSRLDWFAVDLEGEHSAMDGQILEEHTEYVVHAIHRILDLYKESHDARRKDGAAASTSLPKHVILVGHSMGGFVARAAVIHPKLRKSAVETILTLSTPHQSPPVALQPSLGNYFARVNQEWRKGYEVQTSRTGRYVFDALLSDVVVVSISGGYNDYQVRSKLESLDGIVPPTHGFMISSTGMRNVWLSMEHQAILWCNQLVVQVSHTLLSLIDSKTGQPYLDSRKRLAVFIRMLRSGIPQSFNLMNQAHLPNQSTSVALKDAKSAAGSKMYSQPNCPTNINWNDDGLERDLYIESSTVTVLAMDGRRRWLDIQKLGSNGRSHFVFVTNLAPCHGVRIHLWPEKGKEVSDSAANKRILEVTSKLVQIPSGPAPRQIEPGSQTEQPPPTAALRLSPVDLNGYRFLTISVAPRPTISGRPPPAASMAVGQFFNPNNGEREVSAQLMLLSTYSEKDIVLNEDHPLAFNLSFAISLGLLPASLSLKTTGCGIKKSGLPAEEDESENTGLCKLRCFPPVALAWDDTSGLHIFPNLNSETIIVDSSPALWSSTKRSEKSTVLLLVDPHCSYKASVAVSETAAAGRFVLLYNSQIVGLCFAVTFFALMRQAHAWDHDLPIPSMLAAVESNLNVPFPFLLLGFMPILFSLFISLLKSKPIPPFASFTVVSIMCYLLANGTVVLLVLVFQLVFYVAALIHVFIKRRSQGWEGNFCFAFFNWFFNLSSSFMSLKFVRVVRIHPLLVAALTAIILGCLVHPALGLFILLVAHSLFCHNALCSFLTASFRSHSRNNELFGYESNQEEKSQQSALKNDALNQNSLLEENSYSPSATRSFGDTQLEIFHHQHGLLILHFLAALMFVPSLVAWLQRIGMGHSFPWFLDSSLCIGVILYGIFHSKPEFISSFPIPSILGKQVRLDLVYLLAGFYSYISALDMAPYRVFYAMAAIGFVSFGLRILQRKNREKSDQWFGRKRHSHRH